jgi:hypothetical protein
LAHAVRFTAIFNSPSTSPDGLMMHVSSKQAVCFLGPDDLSVGSLRSLKRKNKNKEFGTMPAMTLPAFLTCLIWLCILPLMLSSGWVAYAFVSDRQIRLLFSARANATALPKLPRIKAGLASIDMMFCGPDRLGRKAPRQQERNEIEILPSPLNPHDSL